MRIVITGAFGFIGSHFLRLCVEHLPDIADFLLIDKNTYAADKNRLLDTFRRMQNRCMTCHSLVRKW